MSDIDRPPTPSGAIQWTCQCSNINDIKDSKCSKCGKYIGCVGCTYQDVYGNILIGGVLRKIVIDYSNLKYV